MTDDHERSDEQARAEDDRDPEPLKHVDAERVRGDDQPESAPEEIESDPASNPDSGPLRDIKGG